MDLATLLEGPALAPPENVMPDFANPGGAHDLGYGVIIACAVVATLSVVMRLATRIAMRKLGMADAMYFCALGCFAGHCYAIYAVSIFPGIGVHQWNIQLKNLPPILFKLHIGTVFYSLVCMGLKVGILLDWLATFVPLGQKNFMFWTCWIMIGVTTIFYLVLLPVEIFQCTPREKIWNKLYEGGYCIQNPSARNFAGGFIAAISDLIIFVLPQNVIWRLNMSTQRKIGVSVLFTFGLFACACACARQGYVWHMMHSDDQLYYIASVGLWSMGEMTSGFLIMGIPSVPKAITLVRTHGFGRLPSTMKRTGKGDTAGSGSFAAQSWRRAPLSDRRDNWENLEADEHALVSVRATHQSNGRMPAEGISRSLSVEIITEDKIESHTRYHK